MKHNSLKNSLDAISKYDPVVMSDHGIELCSRIESMEDGPQIGLPVNFPAKELGLLLN